MKVNCFLVTTFGFGLIDHSENIKKLREVATHRDALVEFFGASNGKDFCDYPFQQPFLNLVRVASQYNEDSPFEIMRRFEDLRLYLEAVRDYAKECMELLNADKPRRLKVRLDWYDDFTRTMIGVAEIFAMAVTTSGGRSVDRYATPFTILVFEVEKWLPDSAQSDTLIACQQRIVRARKKLGYSGRQKSR